MDDNRNVPFEKVIEIAEKSVEAWSKAFNKLEDLVKISDWVGQEIKDLNNMLREKPCVTGSTPYKQMESELIRTSAIILEKQNKIEDRIESLEVLEKRVGLLLKIGAGVVVALGALLSLLQVLLK